MNTSRRNFLFSGGAFALAAGCRSTALFGSPDLMFGVVSDIHITTPKSCALFESSLRYFKRRGVDAVMAPGDLTDWGLRSSLVLLKQSWDLLSASCLMASSIFPPNFSVSRCNSSFSVSSVV